ncbi:GtrA family protein [Actinoplanes sp. TRM88002]|uniref:GtrA family protein n=1 Tax=Paractinoplanes hotanensis TaxID=2906497 RepID=A0ABT0YER2_9ACTN|nr:GtrA family protein [Actinoplanes hotanensis]MCM4084018.1 GtrA family protein [Actinoplanes hotanensis]
MTAPGTLGTVPESSSPQPSGLRYRLRALIRELGKFGTVGGVAFAIDVAIFNVLLQAGFETLIAKTISTVIATTFAFLGNRFWTWRHRAHANMARQYTVFFVLNAIGLGIGLACLAISHYGLGQLSPVFQTQLADNISGQLIGTAAGSLFRFWSYRRFVFPASTPPGTPPRQEHSAAGPTPPPSPLRDTA